MKTIVQLLLVSLLTLLHISNAEASHGRTMEFQVEYFYSYLQPYGEWIEFEPGFYCWRPTVVRIGWRPYMVGYWVWSDYGWYWVSHEPFGWIVFHYGRWYYDDFYGWIWIPDHVWGPAWVEWRYSTTHIGWAPLPPYARFSITVGIRYTRRWVAPIHYWNFVEVQRFTTRNLEHHVEPVERSRRLFGYTRSGTRYEVSGDRIMNRGVDRTFIERAARTRIERVEVRESRERGERIFREGRTERIEVFRPDRSERRELPERIEARRAERRPSLELDRTERAMPDDEYERNRQRSAFESRSRQEEREQGRELRRDARPERRDYPAPSLDERIRQREEARSRDHWPERRSTFRPREESERSVQPSPRREERSARPAPPARRDSGQPEPSRKSGGRRGN